MDRALKKAVPRVDYPNRKLGMQHARTYEQDAYCTTCMAQIALANLRVGQTLTYRGQPAVVTAIGKTLTIRTHEGVVRRLHPEAENWEPFVREIGGAILSWHHGSRAHMADLMAALQRDPAVTRDQRGLLTIQDKE